MPEQYGGGGGGAGDHRFNTVLGEELSRPSAATSSAFGIHADICAPYLVDLITDDQKQRWLPGFCIGERITAIGMTEPSGGSDPANLRTTARREGGDFIINGSKTFITNGSTADLVIVGELDRGFHHMMDNLAQERVGAAVSDIAHAWCILDETLEYVKERTAFGRPVGSFQHNAFLLTAVDAAKSKRWTADVRGQVLDACVQLYGGTGSCASTGPRGPGPTPA